MYVWGEKHTAHCQLHRYVERYGSFHRFLPEILMPKALKVNEITLDR